jgi:hypothetical protein
MHLNYNGVDLQIEHTADVSITPVMDQTGLDLLYQRVTVSMICVWNPWATASFGGATLVNTGSNNTNAAPLTGRAGDRLGVSLANLRQVLLTPQQPLKIWLGADRVWDVPARAVGAAPGGQGAGAGGLGGMGTPQTQNSTGVAPPGVEYQFACDPAGGPFPEECRILEIVGDKTAVVQYRITFHVTDCSNYVLSNRWRTTSHTGPDWLTTRITEGRAVMRLDKMLAFGYEADQFRANFILGVPNGFIRKEVNAIATEDGRELYYRVVDKQLAINIPPAGTPGLRVEGHVSTGASWPFHTLTDAIKGAAEAAKSATSFVARGPAGAFFALDDAIAALRFLPTPRAIAVIRVFGPPGCDRRPGLAGNQHRARPSPAGARRRPVLSRVGLPHLQRLDGRAAHVRGADRGHRRGAQGPASGVESPDTSHGHAEHQQQRARQRRQRQDHPDAEHYHREPGLPRGLRDARHLAFHDGRPDPQLAVRGAESRAALRPATTRQLVHGLKETVPCRSATRRSSPRTSSPTPTRASSWPR